MALPNSPSLPCPMLFTAWAAEARALSLTHAVSTAAWVVSAEREESKARRRLGLPPHLGKSNSTKSDFSFMCAWGSVSPETAGEKPTRVIVGDIWEVRLPPDLGFQICQSNATQSRVGICFRVELKTPGNPRELHKGGNFTPHLQTPCLQVHSCL